LGVAAGGGYLPDYPGSEQSRTRLILLPYFNYRGVVLRSDDRSGTRARIINNDWVDFDVSFAGSFPSDSSQNDARRGLPDLDWIGEVGPRVEVLLWGEEGKQRLRFLLPVRVVLSTNFRNFDHRGFDSTPALSLELYHFPNASWKTTFKLQSSFVDEKLARYFYEIEAPYVTPSRTAYGAHGGYLETDVMAALTVPIGNQFQVFTGFWLTSLEGSANQASPLLKSKTTYTLAFGLSWIFYKSETQGEK
jgi:MipA family protein